MKFDAINKMFTEKVVEYMAHGYNICTQSMKGHQGEEGKVDLYNKNELIRVWLSKSYSTFYNDGYRGTVMILRVGVWDKEPSEARYDTVWMDDLDIIEEYKFFEIENHEWYVDDIDEANDIQRMRMDRREKSQINDYKVLEGDRYVDIGVKYLKNQLDYQRVSRTNVKIFTMEDTNGRKRYYITYNGKKYKLY